MARDGFILIADITGYTGYLSHSELEHAQETLTDLLELLVDHTRPPLVISRLEGDAVISYALRDGFVNGQTFVESVENTYVAFRRAIELMVLNNSCQCNACANVSSLDLKFFVHYGTFAVQQIGDHQELVGSDVNLVHRLLKNSIRETTGMGAYVLCTGAAEQALGLGDAAGDMVRLTETVDDFGEVEVWVKDMHPVFEARREEEQVVLAPDEILGSVSTVISMAPEEVWEYVNHTRFRDILMGSDRHELIDRTDGRVGRDTMYQCFHGNKRISQLVLGWHPFEQVLLEQRLPPPMDKATVVMEVRLEPVEAGTRLTQSAGHPKGPVLVRLAAGGMMRMIAKRARADIDAFRDATEADMATREAVPMPQAQLSVAEIGRAAADSLNPAREES